MRLQSLTVIAWAESLAARRTRRVGDEAGALVTLDKSDRLHTREDYPVKDVQ